MAVCTQALKTVVANRYIPLVAILIGVIIAFVSYMGNITVDNVLMGILYGASAAGLYDFGKQTVLGK